MDPVCETSYKHMWMATAQVSLFYNVNITRSLLYNINILCSFHLFLIVGECFVMVVGLMGLSGH